MFCKHLMMCDDMSSFSWDIKISSNVFIVILSQHLSKMVSKKILNLIKAGFIAGLMG